MLDRFPLLIQTLNGTTKYVINSFEELPLEKYFKIVKTKFNGEGVAFDGEWRREEEAKELVIVQDA